MRYHRFWTIIYWSVGHIHWLTGFLLVVIAVCLKTDVNWWAERVPSIQQCIIYVRNVAPVALVVLTFISGICKLIHSRMSPPWVWKTIHEVLDQLRTLAFDNESNKTDPMDYHRVTLFKAIGIKWMPFLPWFRQNYLIAVERSGHTTRKSSVCFKITDKGDNCEGIAGQTWARNETIIVSGLPDICNTTKKKKKRDFNKYAKNTFVSVSFLEKEMPQGRSFCGIPVEANGKLWGVLVFDSRSENSIDSEEVTKVYTEFGRFLGRLLERA